MRARGAHISKMMIIQVERGGEPLQVPRKQQYLEDGADQILVGFLINGGGCEGGRRGGLSWASLTMSRGGSDLKF